MLPRTARLTRSQDYGRVIRRGKRAGRARLVVHAASSVFGPEERTNTGKQPAATAEAPTRNRNSPARVGFVVSKAVGNSVVRHRVMRQLRHLVRARLAELPPGAGVVVRALPAAAGASSDKLGDDLDSALRRLGLVEHPERERPRAHGSVR